ncbi:MAG: LysE family transporter [Proteobacteria bacterium]|nr:LysE family transporter [Pseudomonadota bacterium]
MFFAIGFAAGALTGIPIGPVNVAVIDAAYRFTFRRAVAVGAGGAVADGLYAALGVLGVAPLFERYPSVPPILSAISGVILLIYGVLTARSQPVTPASSSSDAPVDRRREMRQGFTIGLALILLNPAALVTWVVIVSSKIPAATTIDGISFAIGVSVGSFAWFALVAYLTTKGKHVLGDKAAWIPRLIGIALIFYAGYLLVRALAYVIL